MKQVLGVLFLLMVRSIFSQGEKQDLYVVHLDGGDNFKQKIFAYHFVNGVYAGRDEVMNFNGRLNNRDYVRTDRGKNLLYKQRYLVTGIGNIIDLKDLKVVFDGKADLLRISNDSAIYYTNDAFKGKFYSYFNFKTGTYQEIKSLTFRVLPNRDIEFDKSTKPFTLNYYPVSKPKVVLSTDAGFGQQKLPNIKYVPDPPLYWVNDSVFLFPKFNKEGSSISIERARIKSAVMESVGTLSMSSGYREAYFEKITPTLLVLNCSGNEIHVNLSTSQVTAPANTLPQNNFSYSLLADAKGRTVFYNKQEITKIHFDTETFKTCKDYAAFVKVMQVENETYQQGLMVWSAVTKTWQKIDSEEIAAVIGWIEVK